MFNTRLSFPNLHYTYTYNQVISSATNLHCNVHEKLILRSVRASNDQGHQRQEVHRHECRHLRPWRRVESAHGQGKEEYLKRTKYPGDDVGATGEGEED